MQPARVTQIGDESAPGIGPYPTSAATKHRRNQTNFLSNAHVVGQGTRMRSTLDHSEVYVNKKMPVQKFEKPVEKKEIEGSKPQ